jgi:MYXO-CTERM domain-containing protein
VQLFHGDADSIISYKNQGEAIKEWTNVLGLTTSPTTTDTGLTLGTHQATRQRWQNSCGYVVLEAITSIGGDHGPSDAIFNSSHVIPFLGLDQTGATDPEVAKCSGTGGTSGTGGATSTGGTGTGGTRTGGASSTGGNATGGRASGGTPSGGSATGGLASGGKASGGTISATGGQPTGGTNSATGGTGTGGTSVSGGIGGTMSAGGTGGSGGNPEGQGCNCRTAPSQDGHGKLFGLVALCALALRRRRTRR